MSSAANPTREPDALARVERACKSFEETVEQGDARQFTDTKLNEVWEAARAVERKLSAKRDARAFGRVWELLRGLEQYSGPLGILCGTKELAWIWAPIKLCLQVGSEYLSACEKLVKAYGDIAAALPRFDRLSAALKKHKDFQYVLADFYCDIIEFHKRAYKFLRASAWKRGFDSSWGRFEKRFGSILERLRENKDLIDREANAYNVAAIQQMRDDLLESARKEEKRQSDDEFEKVISWLDINDYVQEDHLDRLDAKCHEGTADWFLQHDRVSNWLRPGRKHPLLWINGIPGCGKSVLCSKLISHVREQENSALAFFICDFRSPGRNKCSNVLKQVASQLIKHNRDLIGLVYDEYVRPQLSPTEKIIKRLLPILLSGRSSRLLVDGLDECEATEQREISRAIRGLVDETKRDEHTDCKVGIFSRDTGLLKQTFVKDAKVSLKDEATAVSSSITIFVRHEMQQFRNDNADLDISDEVLTEVEQKLVAKAGGMFLWVHLMIATLNNVSNTYDLKVAVESLPQGIENAYGRILDDFRSDKPHGRLERATAVLSWIALADRKLKKYELLDGAVFCKHPNQLNRDKKLPCRELEHYKPLIEIDSSGYVSLVHFTVKEYILDQSSGPFLQRQQALNDIAMGCVSYIVSSLDLVDGSIEYDDRVKGVAFGLHGLHRYATAKWIHHIEELSKHLSLSSSSPEARLPSLVECIKSLCGKHDRLLPLRQREGKVKIRITDEKKLVAFHDLEEFCHLAALVEEHKRQFGNVVPGHSQVDDPTLFTEVSNAHDTIVQELLKPESDRHINGLTEAEIARFKTIYGDGAYQCRATACPSRPDGFASHEKRIAHEKRAHPEVYVYYCHEPSCPFSKGQGLPTPSRLEEHTRFEHPPEDLVADPSTGRKKRKKPVKRPNPEESCGLDIGDADVDELARMLPRKKHSGENAAVNMAAKEPVLQETRRPTEQQRSAEQDGKHDPSRPSGEAPDATMTDSAVDFDDSIVCICGDSTDYWTVACERCGRMAHQNCYYPPPAPQPTADGFPHYCIDCVARPVGPGGAIGQRVVQSAESVAEPTEAATSSLSMDGEEVLMLSIAVSTLSRGPMTIEDVSNAMGVAPDAGTAAFLRQIADEQAGVYHLKGRDNLELARMILPGIEIDKAYPRPESTRAPDTEQNGQASLQHTDVRQRPELRRDEHSTNAASYPKFVLGQKVFCARDRRTSGNTDDPSQWAGTLCEIVGGPVNGTSPPDYFVKEENVPWVVVSQSRLRLIPDRNDSLETLPNDTDVLAQYLNTTKFRKGTVARLWQKEDAPLRDWVDVLYDIHKEQFAQRVERRFVLLENQTQ